ncbi:hypothetical protein JZ751_009453 [Albula glossodonta]|uniref:Uncharacterized protein n=1 Tax=Albula glossodonta TaxID=121402 RepID=A0A8T2NVC5_9TELE|nr:hypothetical protein JZ751_009453 [Albula glossodonta]
MEDNRTEGSPTGQDCADGSEGVDLECMHLLAGAQHFQPHEQEAQTQQADVQKARTESVSASDVNDRDRKERERRDMWSNMMEGDRATELSHREKWRVATSFRLEVARLWDPLL